METIILKGHRLSNEEKETLISYDYINKVWIMDSTIMKHINKALRQNWTPVKQYVYEDNTVFGMVLTAPERAVTIRAIEKKKLSEKQIKALNS